MFRLSDTELSIQTVGEDMFFCLHTQALECEETGNIMYEDFYAKLSNQKGVHIVEILLSFWILFADNYKIFVYMDLFEVILVTQFSKLVCSSTVHFSFHNTND